MAQCIVYLQDNGVLAVVNPVQEVLDDIGITAIADKSIPTGKPYKIMDTSELPTDLTFRDAWTIDPVLLDSGVSK
jgi:hypothetical protein